MTKRGRPRQLINPKKLSLVMDEAIIERAKEIGSGNISAGIREAVSRYGINSDVLRQDSC
jgi:hypothetical protein